MLVTSGQISVAISSGIGEGLVLRALTSTDYEIVSLCVYDSSISLRLCPPATDYPLSSRVYTSEGRPTTCDGLEPEACKTFWPPTWSFALRPIPRFRPTERRMGQSRLHTASEKPHARVQRTHDICIAR